MKLELDTSAGRVRCTISPARTPNAAALVVGLAAGKTSFVDVHDGEIRRAHFFDGLPIFRRVADAMIQSGCPRGDGTGTPGYRILLETSNEDQALLSHPGALLLAHYQPPPNRRDPHPPPPGHLIGSQFVIALAAMPHLAGMVTVLGQCGDLDVVRVLSRVPRDAPAPMVRSLRAISDGPR